MLRQIRGLFSLATTITVVLSVCFALWVVVGVCVGFGWYVGKALAGII